MDDSKKITDKIHFDLRIITLSLSVFILSVAVFSRVIVISVRNKNKAEVANQQNSQVLSTEDENIVIDQKSLPDVFPTDLPIYPDSVLEDYWVSDSQNVTGVSVVWSSSDNLENVIDFYKNEFSNDNFNGQVVLDDGSSLTMSFGTSEYDGFVGVTSDSAGTVISLTVGIKN